MYKTKYVRAQGDNRYLDDHIVPELRKIGHEMVDHEARHGRQIDHGRGTDFILAAYVPLVIVNTNHSYENSGRKLVVLEVAHLNPDFRAPEIEAIAKKHGFEYAGTIEEKLK